MILALRDCPYLIRGDSLLGLYMSISHYIIDFRINGCFAWFIILLLIANFKATESYIPGVPLTIWKKLVYIMSMQKKKRLCKMYINIKHEILFGCFMQFQYYFVKEIYFSRYIYVIKNYKPSGIGQFVSCCRCQGSVAERSEALV